MTVFCAFTDETCVFRSLAFFKQSRFSSHSSSKTRELVFVSSYVFLSGRAYYVAGVDTLLRDGRRGYTAARVLLSECAAEVAGVDILLSGRA